MLKQKKYQFLLVARPPQIVLGSNSRGANESRERESSKLLSPWQVSSLSLIGRASHLSTDWSGVPPRLPPIGPLKD